ncbi:MAG TPA: cyclase family protein, partial [Pyrinomonadaceae bacterium]
MKCLHLLVIVLIVSIPVVAQKPGAFPSGRVVDLTYAFDADTVYWPTAQQFKLETDFEGMTEKGYFYSAYRYSAAEHGGTHLDSPVHFAKGRYSVDQLPLQQL